MIDPCKLASYGVKGNSRPVSFLLYIHLTEARVYSDWPRLRPTRNRVRFAVSSGVSVTRGLSGDGLHAWSRILILGKTVQNGYGKSKLSTITYFPGARFVIVGMLTRPDSYYKASLSRIRSMLNIPNRGDFTK